MTTSVHLRKIKRPLGTGRVRHEWHLRWRGVNGRHYCKKIGNCDKVTKREAEMARRRFQEEMDRREIPRDKPKGMTIEEFADYHETVLGSDRKPSTLYEYRLSAKRAAEALGPNVKIQDITAADVGRIRARLSGSPATRAKHLSRLRAMFGHAKRWGLIHGDNPFTNQPMPRFTPKKLRIFAREEIEAMIAASATPWWKAFIAVASTAGLRREEILNLMWRDVDFKRQTINVTAKKVESFDGPDGTVYQTLEWSPKTYAMRSIPIPDGTLHLLRELKEESDGSPHCFVSLQRLGRINAMMRDGQRRSRAETCNNILRAFGRIQGRAASRLGIYDWEIGTVHDLRRTYCTAMADVVPMHVLQVWAGHSDITVTSRFYLGVAGHHAERAREALQGSEPVRANGCCCRCA